MPDATPLPLGYGFGGKPLLDPVPLIEQVLAKNLPYDHWYGRANGFTQPLGKAYGIGYVLMAQEDFATLDQTALHALEFEQGDTAVQIDRLTIVSADALYPAGVLDDQTALLVTVADTRIFLQRTVINTGYNAFTRPASETNTDPDYDTNTLNAGNPWTWEEVIDDLWDSLPADTAGVLNKADVTFPDYLPQDLCFYGMTTWEAIFFCLEKLSMVLSCRPSGTYKLYPEGAGAADDHPAGTFDDQLAELEDQTLNQTPDPIKYPESVTVFFPNLGKRRPYFSVNILTADVDATLTTRTGVVDILYDTTNAYYDESNNVTNEADLELIALDRAGQYINGLTRTTDFIVSNGVLNVHTNNHYDSVAWYDHGQGLRTEVHTRLVRRTIPPPCVECGDDTGECHVVRFQVVSVDPTTRVALVEITARPVGCGVGDIPLATVGGTVLEVCDPLGCFFNEPSDELTGRGGWARYMDPVTATVCDPYASPHWEVFSLCCKLSECIEVV